MTTYMYTKPMTVQANSQTVSSASYEVSSTGFFNKTSVVSLVTFIHMLNVEGTGIVSSAVLVLRPMLVNIFAIPLPQEL